MNTHIDVAGYIVLLTALIALTSFCVALFYRLRDGTKSKKSNHWAAKTGQAIQFFGLSIACSSSTMPFPPLAIFLAFGIGIFFVGRYVKHVSCSRSLTT